MGVGIYGLISNMISVLPLDELKAFYDEKMETREYFKTLVKVVKSPVVMVSNHYFHLYQLLLMLCYVHTCVCIPVMNALLLPTENGGHHARLARIPGTA
jgi:hypothetical protein